MGGSKVKSSKKEIRNMRLWQHFKYYLPVKVFNSRLSVIEDYNPEIHKNNFFKYQSYGRKSLSESELEGIKPLIDAQALKEIFLNSLVIETLEWDANGWGWIYPINSTLSGKLDRLTRLAILKIKKGLSGDKDEFTFADRLDFYQRHPISGLWKNEFDKLINRFSVNY